MECPVCSGMITEGMSNCRECGYALGEPVGQKSVLTNKNKEPSSHEELKTNNNDSNFLTGNKKTLKIITVIAILSHAILATAFPVDTDTASSTKVVSQLLIDIILLSFFYYGKQWARIILKIRYTVSLFLIIWIFYSTKSYFVSTIDFALVICILLLLFAQSYSKRTKVIFITYCLLFTALLGLYAYSFQTLSSGKNIISKISSPKVKLSEHNYRVTLPNEEWKFIPKEKTKELLGIVGESFDISIAKYDASMFGAFWPEKIDKDIIDSEFFESMSTVLKEDFFPEAEFTNEKTIQGGKLWVFKQFISGSSYTYVFYWKYLDTLAINSMFWTLTKNKNQLLPEVETFLNNVSEVTMTLQKKQTPTEIKTYLTSQDSEGATSENLTQEAADEFDVWLKQTNHKKTEEYYLENGLDVPKVKSKIDSKSGLITVDGVKLILISHSIDDMFKARYIIGIKNNQLLRVSCIRLHNRDIPLSYGVCGDFITKTFGITISPL